jgi:TonB family protein
MLKEANSMMKKSLLAVWIVLTVATWSYAAAHPLAALGGQAPGRRIAIVVGNNAYEAAPLNAARNDAQAMTRTLREAGFSVTLLEDATRQQIVDALSSVGGKIRPDDVALFYFSGHGAQVDGENYLVPVDFTTLTTEALRLGTIRANEVLKILGRARVTILVLDACRVNPFSGDRFGGRGLAAMEARGTLIAFAAGSDQVALDGPRDGNGKFTSALLREMLAPGVPIQEVFRRARKRVYDETKGQQFPAVYDGLIGDFVFRAGTAGIAPAQTTEREPDKPSPAPLIMTEPKRIKYVEPVYPEDAQKARREGIVILEATTDDRGRVIETKIVRSIPLLDDAAVAAVRQWVYEPYIIDGRPHGISFTVMVRFSLK